MVILALSPELVYEVVTGTGYLSKLFRPAGPVVARANHDRDFAAIAWGLTLASRANFLLLVPLAGGYLFNTPAWEPRRGRWRSPAGPGCGLTLPFYFHA